MKTFITSFVIFAAFTLNAQTLISSFNFNSNPLTQAAYGPNATSISSSATSSAGGVQGNGLNPKGTGEKQDVNMVIPGSPTFDVNGIDISVSYRRNESDAYFFTRGSSMNFGMGGGSLFVTYRVRTGNSTYETVSSGGVYAIPSDDTYRTYRFIYTPTNGRGRLLVNGTVVWSNDGTDFRNLYWTGAGDVIVGQLMDGNGNNKTVLDNFTTYAVTNTALPIELMSFDANTSADNASVNLAWSTASERNNAYFSIERSTDGTNWDEIERIEGAGNSAHRLDYTTVDTHPKSGTVYYRLKQTDFNGEFEIFKAVAVQVAATDGLKVETYPNPTNGNFTVFSSEIERASNTQIRVISTTGNVVVDLENTFDSKNSLDISAMENGTYIVEVVCDGKISRSMILKN